MASFRQIPDEVNKEAGDVLRYVRDGGERQPIEVLPGFEEIVAASVLALEKGAPRLVFDSRDSAAGEWLREGSTEWGMMHRATARAIDMHRTGEAWFEEPNDVMNHVLGDVTTQAQARRMDNAIRLRDPAFEEGLTPAQIDTVRYAKDDKEVAADIRYEAMGAYERLPRYSQEDIGGDLASGAKLSEELKAEVSAAYPLIMKAIDGRGENRRYVENRLGDFVDFGTPLFEQVDYKALESADFLARGEVRLPSKVEMGVMAHERVFGTAEDPILDGVARVARARALVDPVDQLEGPAAVAIAIEADRLAIVEARDRFYLDVTGGSPDNDDLIKLKGLNHHELDPDSQKVLFAEIRGGDRVPALAAMRLARAASELEEERGLGSVRARPERAVDRSITFEGVDVSDQAGHPFDRLNRPGDDLRARRAGVPDGLEGFGEDDVVTVKKTVVTGVVDANGDLTADAEYEFVGRQGRFPAAAFMDHRGEEHTYGMLVVEADRLWMVPMNDNGHPQFHAEVAGAPREVIGTVVSFDPEENAKNLEIMKHEIGQEPSSGEFYFRPRSFGEKAGPVELVSTPWMSGAWSREMEIGMPHVRDAIDNPRAWEFEHASAEWRAKNTGPLSTWERDAEERFRKVEFKEEDMGHVRGDFRRETTDILDGSTDARDVRFAARIAARGRPLDADREADAMIGAETTRRQSVAMARGAGPTR